MRGKVDADFCICSCCRITPAYAGKSLGDSEAVHAILDHPRLCGEKIDHLFLDEAHMGSPPPMRGKVIVKYGFRYV